MFKTKDFAKCNKLAVGYLLTRLSLVFKKTVHSLNRIQVQYFELIIHYLLTIHFIMTIH